MICVSIIQSTETHVYSVVDKSKKKKKTSSLAMVCCYIILYVCHDNMLAINIFLHVRMPWTEMYCTQYTYMYMSYVSIVPNLVGQP